MQNIRKNGQNVRAQSDWLRYHSAEEHVRLLLAGAYRFIEAHTLADVSLPPLNDKGPATVEQLLTYMHQNSLRFSPADANGQTAYNTIFELMSRYYIDLRQLKLDTAQNEQRSRRPACPRRQKSRKSRWGIDSTTSRQTEVEVRGSKQWPRCQMRCSRHIKD